MSAIQKAIDVTGSATKLAAILGVSTQAVCFWRDGKRKIPAEVCILIEKGTHGAVRCNDLRPDVEWGYIRPELANPTTPTAVAAPSAQPAALRTGVVRRQDRRRAEDVPTDLDHLDRRHAGLPLQSPDVGVA